MLEEAAWGSCGCPIMGSAQSWVRQGFEQSDLMSLPRQRVNSVTFKCPFQPQTFCHSMFGSTHAPWDLSWMPCHGPSAPPTQETTQGQEEGEGTHLLPHVLCSRLPPAAVFSPHLIRHFV